MTGGVDRTWGRVLAWTLVGLGGATALALAFVLFPFHSINHDEGVYLQQAELLLRGQRFLHPPVPGAFRPWFFVDSPQGLYAKYAPYPAVLYAAGMALGEPRFVLAAVAGAVVGLTYLVASELTDRVTGLLAAGFVLVSPLFVVEAATFLPYAPVAALDFGFAYAFFRGERTGRTRWAALAGVLVGGAFFARPYTALLFALPFVAYALWTATSVDLTTRTGRALLARRAATAGLGLCGVGVALAYNAATTGDLLVFPYQAFAPADGIGFGYHSLRGYGRDYTPMLALRANAVVVRQLVSRWVAGGVLGSALAAVGLWRSLRRGGNRDGRLLVLAGLYLSVVLGNVYFWGNLNVLAPDLDPTRGLVHYLGPYYHFSLLLPTGVFAALGIRWIADVARPRAEALDRRAVLAVAVVVSVLVVTAVGGALAGPLARNAENTAEYERAYAPFDDGPPAGSVVFLPTPYGPWMNHPMQALRNDPGVDGETVYALDGVRSLDVAAAYPNRTYYRYEYRGTWVPTDDHPVHPAIRRVRVTGGPAIVENLTVRIPPGADFASVRVASSAGHAYVDLNATPGNHTVSVTVAGSRATVRPDGRRANANASHALPVNASDTVTVTVYVETAPGTGFSYRSRMPVATENGTVRALSPYLEVCTDPRTCGGGAAYLPRRVPAGYDISATVTSVEPT